MDIYERNFRRYCESFIELSDSQGHSNYRLLYQWILSTAKRVIVEPISSIQGLKHIEKCKADARACYRNAIMVIAQQKNTSIKYVEGFYLSSSIPIPLPHAWNALDGHYFDITAEFNGNIAEAYFALHEFTLQEIAPYLDGMSAMSPGELHFNKTILPRLMESTTPTLVP